MTLWTPDGERKVSPKAEEVSAAETNLPTGSDAEQTLGDQPELTPEQQQQAAEMAEEISQAREQILQAKVADVMANHAAGIYELAAIHLSVEEPNQDEAKVAVDALAGLLSALEGRLGESEATLGEALKTLQLRYVQVVSESKSAE